MSWFILRNDDPHAVWNSALGKFCFDLDAEYSSDFSYGTLGGAKRAMNSIGKKCILKKNDEVSVVDRERLFEKLELNDKYGETFVGSVVPKWQKGEKPTDIVFKLMEANGISSEGCIVKSKTVPKALSGIIGRDVTKDGKTILFVSFLPSNENHAGLACAIPISSLFHDQNRNPFNVLATDSVKMKDFDVWFFADPFGTKNFLTCSDKPLGWTGKTVETFDAFREHFQSMRWLLGVVDEGRFPIPDISTWKAGESLGENNKLTNNVCGRANETPKKRRTM